MKTILNISVLGCLLGFIGLSLNIGDSQLSLSYESVNSYSDSTISDDRESMISHADYAALFNAEILPDVPSEIDPRTSISANWTSSRNKNSAQLQYLIRSSRFEFSQSVRNLIFPFHSHL